jgi:C4-dicarboxylate-specific signal transduction histidine kinase
MLSFAQQDSARKTAADLCTLLDQTIELVRSDYDIKKEYEDNLLAVLCEQAQIQQVFFNILKNGAQAMTIERIDPRVEKEMPRFTLRIKTDQEMICVEIEDNSPDMSQEVKKRIFKPFFTTKRDQRDTRLGLSISYFIIAGNHNGSMNVKSLEGR